MFRCAHGDSHTDGGANFACVDREGLSDRNLQLTGDAHGIAGIAHAFDQNGELISSQPEQCGSERQGQSDRGARRRRPVAGNR